MGRASLSISFLAHSCDRYLRSPSSARWVRRQSRAASRELLKPWRQEFRTCDLRLRRLGLPGWVPKSPVSLCLSSSAAQFGTPGIGHTDTDAHTQTHTHRHTHRHTQTQTHTYRHTYTDTHTHTHTDTHTRGLHFFISPQFSLLADEEELFISRSKGVSYTVSGELGAAQTAQVCLAGAAWRGPERPDLGEGGVSIRAGTPGPK